VWTPDLHQLGTPAVYTATFLVAFVGGIIPFVINVEVFLIAVAALTSSSPVVVVGLASAGQMLAKYLLYLAGRGVLQSKRIRWRSRDKAAGTFEKYRRHSLALVGFSSFTGFPPFYGISLLAGAARLPILPFLVVGTAGRVVRFTLVYLAPALLQLHR
jgi:membrane protein YqaA with SNARE-associated domain